MVGKLARKLFFQLGDRAARSAADRPRPISPYGVEAVAPLRLRFRLVVLAHIPEVDLRGRRPIAVGARGRRLYRTASAMRQPVLEPFAIAVEIQRHAPA